MSNIVSRMFVSLGLKNNDFKKGLKSSEKDAKSFGSSMKNIATQIGVAFGLREVLKFGSELVKLAGEAEGVQRAFDRMKGGEVFDDLKTATRGTVSNLELMRKTVTAKNLGVPVADLAKLFEFAAARAADTGESVDFLVNSIVVGIGRKSPLILDNLGISAIALKEKMEGVGIGTASVADVAKAVSKIATEELDKIGKSATTNGQKLQSVSASWDNIKLSIGRAVTASKEYNLISDIILGIGGSLDKTSKSQDGLKEGARRIFESFKKNGVISKADAAARIKALKEENSTLLRNGNILKEGVIERRKGNLELIKLLKEVNAIPPKAVQEEIRNIETLAKKITDLKVDQETATGGRLISINQEITALNNEISTLKKLGTEIDKNATKTGISGKQTGLYAKPVDQSVQLPPLELPTTLGTEGTLGGSEQLEALLISDKVAADQEIVRNQLMQTQTALSAYGSVMGSVGQITAAMGDSTIATFANVAAQVISSVAQMIPALFSQSIGGAVAAGSSLPFPANLAAIAAGVAGVVSAFSGIGGGSASAGSSVTSIDTRGFSSPMVDGLTRRTADSQAVNINLEGEFKLGAKDAALLVKQGNKQIQR